MSLKRVEAAVGVLKLPITARAVGCRFAKTAMPTIAPPEVLDTCSMTRHLQKQIVKSILPSGSFGDKGRKIVTVRVSNCVTNRYHQYPFVYNKKLIAQPLRQIQPTGRSEMREADVRSFLFHMLKWKSTGILKCGLKTIGIYGR
jgi:hypothetical protein